MGIKVITTNRKASHEYSLGQIWEAGIQLTGTEVKSLRLGKANLSDGWVDIENGQAFLMEVHISPYSHGNRENHAEKRVRKLLLHKREIVRMEQAVGEQGATIVPIKMYFKDRFVKLEVAVAKGKKLHDKRESKKEADSNRAIARAMRRNK